MLTTQTTLFLIVGIAIAFLGLILFFIILRTGRRDEISRRLYDFVDAPSMPTQNLVESSPVRKRELSGSFGRRILVPGFKRLGSVFGRLTPSSSLERLEVQLSIAGNPLGLGPREFYGLRIIFILIGLFLAYILLRDGINQMNLIVAFLALYICFLLPRSWLSRRVRSRQDKIRRGLPDALDMLSVCADAGLGFDQSLQRVSEYWKTAISEEFNRVVSEMEMGVSRANALRNLAQRLDVRELSTFVTVILQSDQLGMSIADTLHAQAAQMREERRFRAQEQARKIPLKMLFPLLFLIFPSLYAVILGPVVPMLVQFFSTVRGGQ